MGWLDPPEEWVDEPGAIVPTVPDVDWVPPAVVGKLWVPGEAGFELVEYHEVRSFGFARWLDERDA